ncbi:MAG: 5-deoxy-glucuronate isomerase, partial [Treponema sp.]|nr:5-deoxy-glucuronate isomerase [Treponema sp.]
MHIRHTTPFVHGYTPLVSRSGATADMLMEFGVLRLDAGETYDYCSKSGEWALLLSWGDADVSLGADGQYSISRPNLFDYSPWCLSVPVNRRIVIHAKEGGAEFYYFATDN